LLDGEHAPEAHPDKQQPVFSWDPEAELKVDVTEVDEVYEEDVEESS
jgi:hypothetical protein